MHRFTFGPGPRTSSSRSPTRSGEAVRDAGLRSGPCVVYCPHTTAAITIQENADPDVVHDMLLWLNAAHPEGRAGVPPRRGQQRLAHQGEPRRPSVTVLVEDGDLVLGTWQGIYFCEFDGPRTPDRDGADDRDELRQDQSAGRLLVEIRTGSWPSYAILSRRIGFRHAADRPRHPGRGPRADRRVSGDVLLLSGCAVAVRLAVAPLLGRRRDHARGRAARAERPGRRPAEQIMAVGILLAVAAGMMALELAKVFAFVAGGCGAWLAVQWVFPQAQELWAVFLSGGLFGLLLYQPLDDAADQPPRGAARRARRALAPRAVAQVRRGDVGRRPHRGAQRRGDRGGALGVVVQKRGRPRRPAAARQGRDRTGELKAARSTTGSGRSQDRGWWRSAGGRRGGLGWGRSGSSSPAPTASSLEVILPPTAPGHSVRPAFSRMSFSFCRFSAESGPIGERFGPAGRPSRAIASFTAAVAGAQPHRHPHRVQPGLELRAAAMSPFTNDS